MSSFNLKPGDLQVFDKILKVKLHEFSKDPLAKLPDLRRRIMAETQQLFAVENADIILFGSRSGENDVKGTPYDVITSYSVLIEDDVESDSFQEAVNEHELRITFQSIIQDMNAIYGKKTMKMVKNRREQVGVGMVKIRIELPKATVLLKVVITKKGPNGWIYVGKFPESGEKMVPSKWAQLEVTRMDTLPTGARDLLRVLKAFFHTHFQMGRVIKTRLLQNVIFDMYAGRKQRHGNLGADFLEILQRLLDALEKQKRPSKEVPNTINFLRKRKNHPEMLLCTWDILSDKLPSRAYSLEP